MAPIMLSFIRLLAITPSSSLFKSTYRPLLVIFVYVDEITFMSVFLISQFTGKNGKALRGVLVYMNQSGFLSPPFHNRYRLNRCYMDSRMYITVHFRYRLHDMIRMLIIIETRPVQSKESQKKWMRVSAKSPPSSSDIMLVFVSALTQE